jgi:hypothetical protein
MNWQEITDPVLRKQGRRKAWREANKEKMKAWRENNKERLKAWREDNKDILRSKRLIYKRKNKDKIKAWYENNKGKMRDRRRSYKRNRFKNDIQFKLSENLRKRLNVAFKGNCKAGSAVRDLGCTIPELKSYLESKFQPGMSWDNYGFYGWHIDHIKPLSSFDLSDRKQLLEACHYTNLQPLWWTDNLSKSDKHPESITSPVQR